MLVLLGTFGLVQALALPGWIAARCFGVRGSLRLVTTGMALSLLINLGLVSLLVALHAYRQDVMLAIFAAECALAAWLWSRGRGAGGRAHAPVDPPARLTLAEITALAAVVALALWFAGRVVRAGSGIFTGWDDVASWNRWAMDWSRGSWPRHTWHYPQILPVAWSLTYVFMGTAEVQSFARGMMPLFALATLLALVDLARAGDRLRYLAAAWFAGVFLARVNDVTAGLADLPVAFLATLALAESLRPGEAARARRRGAGFFSAGAALAKQAGLFVALVAPALAARTAPAGRRARVAFEGYAIVALVALPWYVLKQFEILSGRDTSEVGYVLVGVHAGLAPLARAAAGISRLAAIAGGPLVLAVLFALGLLGLRDRTARPIVLAVAIPFTAIWAFGFSYDPRNLSVGLVAWAIACGAGLAEIADRVPWPASPVPGFALRPPPRSLGVALAVLAVVALTVVPLRCNDAALLAHQRRLRRGLGDPLVSAPLSDLRESGRLRGRIVADPGVLLAYAPGWDTTFVVTPFADAPGVARDVARPGVRWLLVPSGVPADVAALLRDWRREGRWSPVRELGGSTLWRRRSGRPGGRG